MRHTICFILAIGMATSLFAQSGQPLPLYPHAVPGAKTPADGYAETATPRKDGETLVRMVTQPTLTPFFPPKEKANGTAVVICPGGGYGNLVIGREGYAIAKRFNEAGVAAFVLKYRLPSDRIMADKSIGPLQDAQSAIKMVRDHAAEWKIQPNRIGIIGFSAGGHLASTAGTHFNRTLIDNPQNTSLRPDFMILIYPVISFGEYAHAGSVKNLIGPDADSAHIRLYTNQLQVTAATPPTFLLHAQDDKVVPVQNSLMFYEALLKAGVKAEMHLYQSGGHGFGLHNKSTRDEWFDRCTHWMEVNGLLTN
jgi:acetyl esterase/lipase